MCIKLIVVIYKSATIVLNVTKGPLCKPSIEGSFLQWYKMEIRQNKADVRLVDI